MAGTVLLTGGDVIEVQLTSETVVIEGAHGRRASDEPGHITNRMRLFVRETDGKEAKYDFEECELGVRDTQRVAIARAKFKGRDEPLNLILFNLSTGEKDCFESGLFAHLAYRPFFGAKWKAFFFSLLIAFVFFCVSFYIVRHGDGAVTSTSLAIMFAFLLYPLLWWICGTWDRVTERIRYKKARRDFIAEMEGRARVYAPSTAPAAPPA
ncbi:hypothetical protein U91I_03827 [alpha proteobacterium U9-1i]|nr:hypothetical protein U91I_03827 [alpha proteobacterium U9-1i]